MVDSTMPRIPDDLIASWLEAERSGRSDEADGRLHGAMRSLGRFRPTPGFADRVLVAAGITRVRRSLFASGWTRAATVSAIVLAGFGALSVPFGALLIDGPSHAGRLLAFVVALSLRAAHLAEAAVALLTLAAQVGDAVQLAAGTPGVLAVIVASALVAAASLVGLGRLLAPREELYQCS
jgi:hypothetical protein